MNISHITYVLPETLVSILELANQGEMSSSEAMVFERMMGLHFVPRDKALTHFDQISCVLDQFFNECPISRKKIRYFIYAHTADDVSPTGISILSDICKKYHLNESIFFGASLHKCASIFQLLILSSQLFESILNDDCILLIMTDLTFTSVMQYIPGSTVLGDSSAIILLEKQATFHRVIDLHLKEEGYFSRGLLGSHQEQLSFQVLYSDFVANAINVLLEKNKLFIDDVRFIFPHNVNLFSWKEVAKKMKITPDKFFLKNIPKIGHCFGSDPFINLLDCLRENGLMPGDYYILVTVGLGATFASMLVQY